jgi:hypothetical protein
MKEEKVDIFEESTKKYSGVSYIKDYEDFMNNFSHQNISGAEVGEMVARMAQHFTNHNLLLGRALRVYKTRAQKIYNSVDANGKPITASKAEIEADATDEAFVYQEAKINVQNIEQMINALKSLQRGILKEESVQY